jgi:hypothetical protein
MCKGASVILLAQKMLFCFTNIASENLLQMFGYTFCPEQHILPHFCQTLFPQKAFKIIHAKAALLCRQKCW